MVVAMVSAGDGSTGPRARLASTVPPDARLRGSGATDMWAVTFPVRGPCRRAAGATGPGPFRAEGPPTLHAPHRASFCTRQGQRRRRPPMNPPASRNPHPQAPTSRDPGPPRGAPARRHRRARRRPSTPTANRAPITTQLRCTIQPPDGSPQRANGPPAPPRSKAASPTRRRCRGSDPPRHPHTNATPEPQHQHRATDRRPAPP